MKYTQIIIRGFVQGVGYRKFVRDNARKMGLVGYVRNLSDNSVEVIVSGSKENIDRLILLCKKGPFLSEVKDVQIKETESNEEFSEFLVKHDF